MVRLNFAFFLKSVLLIAGALGASFLGSVPSAFSEEFTEIPFFSAWVHPVENFAPKTSEPAPRDWFLKKIQAPAFWVKSQGSRSVRVLLCDTGVFSGHPDLKSNISLPGMNFVDGTNNTEPTGNPHGTRMAGVIGAWGDRPESAIGLNREVSIIPGKISNEASGLTDHKNTAQCIRWGADQGIRIVNVSISGGLDNEDIAAAARYLHEHNGILVMPSGNDGATGDVKPIADNPDIIVVGATDPTDWKPRWSGRGPYVDLVAPGTQIYTTTTGGGEFIDQGTSISAAMVSGAAALILSYRPRLSAQELRDVLLAATDDLSTPGRDDAYGMGRLNLQKALDLLGR